MGNFSKLSLIVFILFLLLPVTAQSASNSLEVRQDANLVAQPPSPGGGAGGGGVSDLQFTEFSLGVQDTFVSMDWETNHKSRYTLKWGETLDYEIGTATSNLYVQRKHYTIEDLIPSTTYYYELTVFDSYNQFKKQQGSFVTIATPDNEPPDNVLNFIAQPQTTRVVLNWSNPNNFDYAGVRIVRSTKFYPNDVTNGMLVYLGKEDSFVDYDVVPGVTYYYTAFSFDRSGNYSSGAISSALILWYSDDGSFPPVTPTTPTGPTTGEGNQSEGSQTDGLPLVDISLDESGVDGGMVTLDYFNFSSKALKNTLDHRFLTIPYVDQLVISIEKNRLPKNISSIQATIYNLESETGKSNFLFKYNADTQRYELILPRLGVVGNYKLEIKLVDNDQKLYQSLATKFKVIGNPTSTIIEDGEEFWQGKDSLSNLAKFMGLGALLGIVWYVLRTLSRRPRKG